MHGISLPGLLAATAVTLAAGIVAPAHAADEATDFPSRPIRIVVPYPAGGSVDLLARALGERVGAKFGQPVVVESRPGAGSNIGAAFVAKAPADGYTLLLGTPGTQIINAYVYKKIGYDPVKDFAPVAYVAQVPNVVLTHPGSGLKNMEDLLRTARAEPGRLNWGSPGVGSSGHLALEMIKRMGKVDIRHVPYKGASQANNDLLGGQIDLSADNLPTALPLIKAGKLVALGVTSAQPVPAAPGVAAIAQAVPGFELTSWFVVMAPAGTPQPVIDKLNAAAQRVLDSPATRERLAALAAQPMGGTPQALAQHLQTEREKYRVLIEGTDIRPE